MAKAATKRMTPAERTDALAQITDDELRAALARRLDTLAENIKKAREQIADIATNRLFDHIADPTAEEKALDLKNIDTLEKNIKLMEEAKKDIERRQKGAAKLLRAYGGGEE